MGKDHSVTLPMYAVYVETENRPLIIDFAAALAALLFFSWLAHAVLSGQTAALDVSVRNAIHGWARAPLTTGMRGITNLGSTAFLALLGLIVVWRLYQNGRRRAAVVFVIAALGADLLDQLLKLWFRRPRPEAFFGLAQPGSYSFPSGHSVESCCFYGALAAILTLPSHSFARKAAIWGFAALLTLAIGFSRIYLGVHYPTDVMGGYAAGVLWAATVRACYQLWLRRAASRLH